MKIYITTCDKRFSYALMMKEMLKDSPYEYVFVYGKGGGRKVEPYIECDVEEAYEKLPEKTFCLVKHFMTNHEDEKLVKTNDDIFLDTEKLKRYEHAPEDYIGYFHDYGYPEYGDIFHWYKIQNPAYRVPKKTFPLLYAEGSTYILSRKACNKLLSEGRGFFETKPEDYIGEDVHVGMSLADPSITKRDIKHHLDLPYEITEDFMSIHPISLLMFKKLNEATTNHQKVEILTQFGATNENLLRLRYLAKVKAMMDADQLPPN